MEDWPGQTQPGERPDTHAPALDPPAAFIPPYNVVLHDDDDHTYGYVIRMLQVLFAFPPHKGMRHALEVDTTGRTVLLTTTREHAELKQEQIHAFGPDPSLERCAGSMTATIEPAF